MDEVPCLYCYIHFRIKEKHSSCFVNIHSLKETINRGILIRGGVPNFLRKEVIEELIKYKLLNRVNRDTYKILNNKYSERKIRKLKIIDALP